ncbi:YcnI family protein [Microbacterium sp. A204]|uniref:YcnI family protein n=1 Tax=Microbacterium sp. A204 TaxID=3457321 RepID=UPI003FD357CA
MLKTHRGALIAALAAGLVLAAPAAAQAHVGVSPDSIASEGSAVLTFSFTHGCENSPTTALRITMPDGLTSVSPTADSLWDIAIERADNGLVSAVTYTAATPVAHDLRGAVTMAVGLGEDAPDTLVFPVEQKCETGTNEWVQIAEDGEDPHDLEAPAPVVTVGTSAIEGSDAGHADHADHGTSTEETRASGASDPLPAIGIALGSAGLVAGIVALVIAVRTSRRERSGTAD